MGHADLRGERPGRLPRASTSCARCARFDPCLPCGVHMYLGERQDAPDGRTRRCSARSDGMAADRSPTASWSRGVEGCSTTSRTLPDPAARRRRPSSCRRCSTSTARGWRGSCAVAARTTAGWRRRSPTTSWSSHLLLLHGLHPVPLEARVRAALDEVRPYLESHGGDVELLGDRGRRRAAAAAGQLQRLPVLDGDAEARRSRRRSARRRPTSSGIEARGRAGAGSCCRSSRSAGIAACPGRDGRSADDASGVALADGALAAPRRRRVELVQRVAEERSSAASSAASRSRRRTGTCSTLRRRELLCACRACSLLFDRDAAGGGHYRLVPDRRLRLDRLRAGRRRLGASCGSRSTWRSSSATPPRGGCVAFYPSPMGPTESLLELSTWDELERANPVLRRSSRTSRRCWSTARAARGGSGSCRSTTATRSSGVIRTRWRGFTGGTRGVAGDRRASSTSTWTASRRDEGGA